MTERLDVVADLRLEVDGDVAQVSGDGNRLRVTTDHPTRLLRRATALANALSSAAEANGGRPLTRQAAQLAGQLADSGLTLTLAGPRRDVLHVGADAGRTHVRLAIPQRVGQIAAGFVTAAVVVLIARNRRR